MKRATFIALVAATLAGCVVRAHRPPPGPPPPGPPPPAPMSYQEAVELGSRYAHSRGFHHRLKKAELERHHRVWELRFAVHRRDARGELRLAYDAYSRALLSADEKMKSHRHRDHDEDDDDDDDDDDDHRGKGHGRHH
jgi:hypothetical protein